MTYFAPAVYFDGTTYLKTTGLVGTPSNKMMVSGWVRSQYTALDTTRVIACLFQADGLDDGSIVGSTIYVAQDTTPVGYLRALASDDVRPGPSDRYWYKAPPSGITIGRWCHWLCTLDSSSASPQIQMYIDGVSVPMSINFDDGTAPFLLDLFSRNFYIPDWKTGFTNPTRQDMADFMLWSGIAPTIDAGVLALFRDSHGKPVDPAAAVASLGQPVIMLSGDASAFGTNQGTGGALSLLDGTFTDATSSPSEPLRLTGRILLADGVSYLLLTNGDHALLTGGAAVTTSHGQLLLVNGTDSLLYVNGTDHVLLMQSGLDNTFSMGAQRIVLIGAEDRDSYIPVETRDLVIGGEYRQLTL